MKILDLTPRLTARKLSHIKDGRVVSDNAYAGINEALRALDKKIYKLLEK